MPSRTTHDAHSSFPFAGHPLLVVALPRPRVYWSLCNLKKSSTASSSKTRSPSRYNITRVSFSDISDEKWMEMTRSTFPLLSSGVVINFFFRSGIAHHLCVCNHTVCVVASALRLPPTFHLISLSFLCVTHTQTHPLEPTIQGEAFDYYHYHHTTTAELYSLFLNGLSPGGASTSPSYKSPFFSFCFPSIVRRMTQAHIAQW